MKSLYCLYHNETEITKDDLLNIISDNSIIKDYSVVNKILNSKYCDDDIIKRLCEVCKDPLIFIFILENKYNDHLVNYLLNDNNLESSILSTISKKCDNSILKKILEHKNCDKFVLNEIIKRNEITLVEDILNHKNIDEINLELIIDLHYKFDISIIKHRCCNYSILNKIFKYMSEDQMYEFINNENFNEIKGFSNEYQLTDYILAYKPDVIKILLKKDCSNCILSLIVRYAYSVDILTDVLKHKEVNEFILIDIINNCFCDTGVVEKVLTNKFCDSRVKQEIIKKYNMMI